VTVLSERLAHNSLTASWLGSRLGIGPTRVEILRRSGQLVGVRPPGARERVYPSWQFGPDGKPIPSLGAIVAEARRAGLDDDALCRLMERRVGLGGTRRLADTLADGDDAHVLEAIRSA
jgi:hypothetical protein